MKIAIFSDPHLGYARFEEDSYIQAERAIASASKISDLIICAGDIFDIRIPKLETLKRAIEIFRKATVPVVAIHGNHERRTKELVNPAQLLAASTGVTLLHGTDYIFEKNNEKVQILGLGSVPEEYASVALLKILERHKPSNAAFRILVLHQSIKELIPNADDEISLEYLETLPFDLIVNGHIHETIVKLDGRFLIPGSTVITQLKKDQVQPKGYFLYDTQTKTHKFIPIESRKFFYEEIAVEVATNSTLKTLIEDKIKSIKTHFPDALIVIKLHGALKSGLSDSDILVPKYENVFIENRLTSGSLGFDLEKIRDLHKENLNIRELAISELFKRTKDKITLFSTQELFEHLTIGSEEAEAHLSNINKKNVTS